MTPAEIERLNPALSAEYNTLWKELYATGLATTEIRAATLGLLEAGMLVETAGPILREIMRELAK
jgi:hypothetical protein